MRPTLLALGALAAAALLVWGIALAADAVSALSSTRIGDTRTGVPGTREVELEPRKHTVFYEVDEGGSVDVPPLELAIRPVGDRPPLEVEGYSGELELTNAGRHATAIGTVRVPEEGRYRIRVTGRVDARSPAIVLGRPITARVVRLLLATAAVVAGLGLAALVAAIGLAVRARRAKLPEGS